MRIRIVGVAIAAVLVILVGALQWRPVVRMLVEERLAALTGCAVRIDGPVGVSPGWVSELQLAALAFAVREGGSSACRGKLAELSVSFRLWGLRLEALDAREGDVPLGTGEEAATLVVESLAITPGAQPETLAAALSGRVEHGALSLPVEATALLVTRGRLGVSDLDLRVGDRASAWLEIAGEAASVAPPEAFELTAQFGWADIRALGPLVGDPPDLGPVAGSLVTHDRSGVHGIYGFTLKGGRPGVFEIDAEGDFEDVANHHGLDFRLDLTARDLSVLGELLRTPLPAAGPVAFSGRVAAQERRFSADDLSLDVGESHLSGSFTAHLPEAGRPRFEARLDVKPLQLAHLGIEPRERSGVAGATAAHAWSGEPFDLAWLRGFDGKLVARATDVRGVNGALLEEMSFEGELEQGKLSLRHLSVYIDGGRVKAELSADASVSPPAFSLQADAHGIEMSQLLEQIEKSSAYSGVLHGRVALKGRGSSPRALAGSLDGEFSVVSPGGTIATEHATVLTKDFFSVLRPSQRNESETLNCLIMDLGFAAGVGTVRTWLLDVTELVVIGAGQVDLGARRFDMRFVPRPRDPSPFSTAATIRLTGPLTSPTVTTEKASLLTSTSQALFGTVPWLTRSREVLRHLTGAGAHTGRCAELLQSSP